MQLIQSVRPKHILVHNSKMVYKYVMYTMSILFTEYGKEKLGFDRDELMFKITVSKIKDVKNVRSKYYNIALNKTKEQITELAKANNVDINILEQLQEELYQNSVFQEELENMELISITG